MKFLKAKQKAIVSIMMQKEDRFSDDCYQNENFSFAYFLAICSKTFFQGIKKGGSL